MAYSKHNKDCTTSPLDVVWNCNLHQWKYLATGHENDYAYDDDDDDDEFWGMVNGGWFVTYQKPGHRTKS